MALAPCDPSAAEACGRDGEGAAAGWGEGAGTQLPCPEPLTRLLLLGRRCMAAAAGAAAAGGAAAAAAEIAGAQNPHPLLYAAACCY
eukprot:1151892-Pelagomonas_calceolata.AAC.3